MSQAPRVSIWFFIGAILLIYGALILSVGIYHLFIPPAESAGLGYLHADLWWGALLLLWGLLYSWKHWPSTNVSPEKS